MENLPSINEILDNKFFQVGMIVWVVFFSGCMTAMVPDNFRRLLDNSAVRVAVLGLVVYLAPKDFRLAVLVSTGYFISTAPMNIQENMAIPSDCNSDDNRDTILGSLIGCKDTNNCEIKYDNLTGKLPESCVPKCETAETPEECGSSALSGKCGYFYTYDQSNQVESSKSCKKRCNHYTDEDDCNRTQHCNWKNDGTDDICASKCDQHKSKDACTNEINSKVCKWTNDNICTSK